MKTNKKAVLGMLVAIVISLGVMGGINNNNDSSLQQVSLSCMSNASNAEGVGSGTSWTVVSGVFGCAASHFYAGAIISAATGVGAPVAVANALLGGICTL